MSRVPAALLFALVVAAQPASASPGSGPPLYDVEILPPVPGQDSVFPKDMNEGAVIVGIAGSDPFDPLAVPVLAAPGHFLELEQPTDSLNFALGIGRADVVTGSSSNRPLAWVRGVPQPLRPVNGLPSGFGWDANERGVIVGEVYADFSGRQFPVAWPRAGGPGFTLEGLGGSPNGVAFAINERGQVAGDAVGGAYPFVGVRWDRPRQEPLQIGPLPGAENSEAVALNGFGDVAGRSSFADGTVEAMLYVEGTGELIGLGFLAGPYSFANDVNDARQVVGTANAGEAVVHAFLWDDGVLFDLNDLVATSDEPFEYLSNAVAVDDLGRIAAEAVVTVGAGMATRIARLVPHAG